LDKIDVFAAAIEAALAEAREERLRLPHPIRCDIPYFFEMLSGVSWPAFKRFANDQGHDFLEFLEFVERAPGMAEIKAASAVDPSDSFGGNYRFEIGRLWWYLKGERQFGTTDVEEARLLRETIEGGGCVEKLHLPHPACYIAFGESRNSPYRIWNQESGEHIAEGAYLFECRTVREEWFSPELRRYVIGPDTDSMRGIWAMFIGSPLGHRNAMDDATHDTFIPIPKSDEKKSVDDLIARTEIGYAELLREKGIYAKRQRDWAALVRHVTKILLYMEGGMR
jgi:hypothetical protein